MKIFIYKKKKVAALREMRMFTLTMKAVYKHFGSSDRLVS